MSKRFLLVFLFVLPSFIMAQNSFKGKILDYSTKEPISEALIMVIENNTNILTNNKGEFSLSLEKGKKYSIMVTKENYEDSHYYIDNSFFNTADEQIFNLKKIDEALGEIVISVGSRAKQRTIVNTSVPVSVLTSEDIAQSGYTATAELIQMLVPSFQNQRIVRGDGAESIRPSSMRGMGTDQMLVLVNGKRRHISSFLIGDNTGVDLNAIPVTAIKTIEVLKDGASALYGSDAIAGVLNIILNDDLDGVAEIQAGMTARNDGENIKLGLRKGFALSDKTILNLSLQGLYSEKTVRAGVDNRKQYFGTIIDEKGDVVYSDPEGDLKNEEYKKNPKITMIEGDPDNFSIAGFYNLNHNISDNASIYSFGGYSYINTLNGSNRFRLPSADGNVRAIFPDGFLARGRFIRNDISLSAGYKNKSSILGKYDLSLSFGNSLVDIGIENSVNTSLGEKSPTNFHLGKQNFTQFNINTDFIKELDANQEHILSYGLDLRNERYKLIEGEENSYIDGGIPIIDGPNAGKRAPVGSQGFVGYRPDSRVNKDRNIFAAYIDYDGKLIDEIDLGLSGRYEYYSDFGSTINGKVSARYEFIKGYAFRSAFNTGFRAPSLQQSYFSHTQTNFRLDPKIGEIVSRENSTLSLDSDAAKALGATSLKPEKSYNISFGFTAQPLNNLFLTIDYYNVKVSDRIVRTSFFTVDNPLIENLFEKYNIKGIQSVRYFANAIDTRTQGLDLVAQYILKTENVGEFTFWASYNFNLHKVVSFNNPPNLEVINENIFNEERQAAFSKRQNNINLSVSNKYNKLQSSIKLFYAGKVSNSYPIKEEVIGLNTMPQLAFVDVDVSYDVIPDLKLTLGVNNLFDKMPPLADNKVNFNGNFKYYNGNGSQLGTVGAFYYLKTSYRF